MNASIVLEELQSVDNEVTFQCEVRKPVTFQNERRRLKEIHSPPVNKSLEFLYLCFKGNTSF